MKEVLRLQRQNTKNLALLSEHDSDELIRLDQYIQGHRVNEYDSAQIQSDLIAMLLDARKRGETIDDVLGEDKEAFCRQLLESARPMTLVERIGFLTQYTVGFMLFSISLLVLMTKLNRTPGYMVPLTIGKLSFVCTMAFMSILWRKQMLKTAFWSARTKLALGLAGFSIWFVLRILPARLGLEETVLCYFYGPLAIVLILALFVASTAARYCHSKPPQLESHSPPHPH